MALTSRSTLPFSLIPLAVFVVLAASSRELRAQAATPPVNVTAVGCLAQLPDSAAAPPTGHEQDAAKGLALTRVAMPPRDAGANTPRSAVPGSRPAGSGTGTTDSATPRPAAREEQSFWLVGSKAPELLRLLGRRIEVTGPIDERLAPNPGNQSITDAGASSARRATTVPAELPATAHPSAPSRAISVSTFRLLNENCS